VFRRKRATGFAASLRNVFTSSSQDAVWQGIQDALLQADVGVAATDALIGAARKSVGRSVDEAEVTAALQAQVLRHLDRYSDRALMQSDTKPTVILIVGVNGTGKTTSVGKLAFRLGKQGHKVVVGAADTFRAAAADQLDTWAQRTGATLVRGIENGDPAAVAFDTVAKGVELGADYILIDTAGRLHTKQGLMDELSKLQRVVERTVPVTEVLLVLDATTGQNGLPQAKVFAEAVAVTGIVLTKLDGTAKGGIVLAVQEILGKPVKFVGVGESAEDLVEFNSQDFVRGLFS